MQDLEPRFAFVMAQYLTKASLTPEEFRRLWKSDLELLAGMLKGTAAKRITELTSIYNTPLPPTVETRVAESLFPGWRETQEMRQTFSALLQTVGHLYARSAKPGLALPRFALAFAIDTANYESLFYALNLLASTPDELDPEGVLLGQMATRTEESDQPGWLTDTGVSKDFYALLGNAWVARSPLDGLKVQHRAITAWETALANKLPEERTVAEETGYFPTAILHRNLAQAYASLGESGRSFQHYLAAAEAFTQVGVEMASREAIAQARRLPYQPSSDEQLRLAKLIPSEPPSDAPIIITAYLDPSSAKSQRTVMALNQVKNQYKKDQVRLALWPSEISRNSKESEAELCAGEQGKLWEMQALLFNENRKLNVGQLKAKAASLGLHPETFDACLDSGKYTPLAKAQIETVDKIGVSGGHAVVFVNGRFVGSSKTSRDLFGPVNSAVQKQSEQSEQATAAGPP